MLTDKWNRFGSMRSPDRQDRYPSPVPTTSSVNLKMDEMRARLQIKQNRPKTALDESKRAEILDKARAVQDKISKSYLRDEEVFQSLQERLAKLKATIEKTQLARESIGNSHPKDLKDLGTNFGKEIAAEAQQHISHLSEVHSDIVAKSHALQSEVQKSIITSTSGFKKKEEALISDTETVIIAFQQQKRDRELFFESLINKLGGAMLNLHERLVADRAERDQTHRQRLRDIAEMKHRFVKAIEVDTVT